MTEIYLINGYEKDTTTGNYQKLTKEVSKNDLIDLLKDPLIIVDEAIKRYKLSADILQRNDTTPSAPDPRQSETDLTDFVNQ